MAPYPRGNRNGGFGLREMDWHPCRRAASVARIEVPRPDGLFPRPASVQHDDVIPRPHWQQAASGTLTSATLASGTLTRAPLPVARSRLTLVFSALKLRRSGEPRRIC